MACALALSILIPALAASAQPNEGSGWYRGLIGRTAEALDTAQRYENNKEVEMRLDVQGAKVTGRYFYFDWDKSSEEHRGADIPIRGTIDADGNVRLQEFGARGRLTGTWVGTLGFGELSGTWTAPGGKRKLKFSLRLIEEPAEGEQVISPGIAYRASRVRGTDVSAPFLTRHPDPRVLEKVNRNIEGLLAEARCDPRSEFPAWPDDTNVTWKVTYASPDFFSAEVTHSFFCGLAHDNLLDKSFVIDLHTGDWVSFADLFHDYEKNPAEIIKALFGTFFETLPEECASVVDVAELIQENRFEFRLSERALIVQASLPYRALACQDSANVTVPYENLRRVAAPGSPILRILDRR